MKIAKLESLHADAGTRNFDFLKLTTDTGLVGWSEYNETFGGPGLSAVIERLAPAVIGKDPRAWEAHVTHMYAVRRQSSGGVVQQAIAAIENAMLDVKARALGIPVYEMLGGPVRDRIRLYWSHCGTYRVRAHKEMQIPPVRDARRHREAGQGSGRQGLHGAQDQRADLRRQPAQLRARLRPTGEGFPELNPDRYVIKAIQEQLAAFREGAGPDMDIMVDLNFNYKTEGFVKMARAMEPFDLLWMELDTRDPKALQYIRSRAPMPVASCESLFGRRDYRPYFENYSVDVAIIDTPWNGVGESVKIANMADTYEINVAPHNFYGPLATMMSAHFCAVVPNLRIMETDPDTVPWHDDLVTVKPAIKDGHISLPTGPGWGTEINEATVRAHPPRQR